MDRTSKGTIAVIIALVIVFFAIYGSYLPMRKSQIFIGTLQSFQKQPPTSLKDLEDRLGIALDYPSPSGQEELVRNTVNSVLGFLQQNPNATTTAALVQFQHGYMDPVIARGRGMSFGQDVYLEGAVNEIALGTTGQPIYLADAIKYYSLGHELGPNRPQPLYGLFDVYRAAGDVTDTKIAASKILANWPTDQRIAQSMAQFLMSVPGAKSSGK